MCDGGIVTIEALDPLLYLLQAVWQWCIVGRFLCDNGPGESVAKKTLLVTIGWIGRRYLRWPRPLRGLQVFGWACYFYAVLIGQSKWWSGLGGAPGGGHVSIRPLRKCGGRVSLAGYCWFQDRLSGRLALTQLPGRWAIGSGASVAGAVFGEVLGNRWCTLCVVWYSNPLPLRWRSWRYPCTQGMLPLLPCLYELGWAFQ